MATYLCPRSAFYNRHPYSIESLNSGIEEALGLVSALLDSLSTSDSLPRSKFAVDENGVFKFNVDISGYQPEELKIDMEGKELVISGRHSSEDEHGKSEHQFTRRFLIPESIDPESIKANILENKSLEITGNKLSVKESEKKSIEINVKPTEQPKEESNTLGQDSHSEDFEV
ncbi:hypothetical protein FO519_004185 [Halicephalobus sp. NKZ332]|nr:hypothetical protein FO519_004185 [Halicephalobus sp. NKZ332]